MIKDLEKSKELNNHTAITLVLQLNQFCNKNQSKFAKETITIDKQ